MPFAPKHVPIRPNYTAPPRKATSARGYGTDHQRQRERLLGLFPICQVCGENWSTDLHHIDGNTGNRADANALMVCEGCHHGRIHGADR